MNDDDKPYTLHEFKRLTPDEIADASLFGRIQATVHALDRLTRAIHDHRSQRSDDRCVEDDDKLYEALGDGIKCDRRVGSKEDMLKNCARFIDKRCEAGGWPTYKDLENKIEELQGRLYSVKKERDDFFARLSRMCGDA